ncbi:tetratricopeptide repeat protein [Fulvimarina sp. MAC3]|uniref:tetratricopeptide repeat protein n=1 Tax=Fulvimarina sp. MAC3 TaxID=3148887 RepID=UPI0031FBA36D
MKRALASGVALAAVLGLGVGSPAMAQVEGLPATPGQANPGELLPLPDLRLNLAPTTGAGSTGEPNSSTRAYAEYQIGNYLTAKSIAEPLAKLGDAKAQALLGEIYSEGLGVPIDADEAARWFEAAAKSGDRAAQFEFAMLLLSGTGIARDEQRALGLLKEAADAKLPLAEFNYAQLLVRTSPTSGFADALPYFRSAADAGIADAQYAMSQLLATGRGTDKDEAEARLWLRRAAINGFSIAEIEYGIWLINGRGGQARPREGFSFLKSAALRGNPIAVNRVAHLYKDGLGTEPNREEAAKWAVIAKRLDNSDPALDTFFNGLSDEARKTALEEANRFTAG